ncbi:hypothetical protein [Sphingopyxis chilensis]
MQIVIDADDLSKLKPATRDDLLATLFGTKIAPPPGDYAKGFDWGNVVDLTPEQVALFMEGAADKTQRGLKVIAEKGPVILASELASVGITNYGHFQGRVTQRTRTVTHRKRAYLFSWDDWNAGENAERGFGHYAVTGMTWRSLREHFGLD